MATLACQHLDSLVLMVTSALARQFTLNRTIISLVDCAMQVTSAKEASNKSAPVVLMLLSRVYPPASNVLLATTVITLLEQLSPRSV